MYVKFKDSSSYLFDLKICKDDVVKAGDKDEVDLGFIDAMNYGNMLRFINHSEKDANVSTHYRKG